MSNVAATQRQAEAPPTRWKRLELAGRRLLMFVLGVLLGKRKSELALPLAPRFLLVRLDERVGNLVMLTPMIRTLRERYPDARIDVLGNVRGEAILADHPDIDAFLCFRKRALFAADGPLRISIALRRRCYSVAVDASNPTDPSLTQAVLVALSGARYTLGSTARGYGSFYSHSVDVVDTSTHEIDLRLALLRPLPGDSVWRSPSLPLEAAPTPSLAEFLAERAPYVVLNVGARLLEKQLSVQEYVEVAAVLARRKSVVLTWGPTEVALARAVAECSPTAVLAPPTDLRELQAVLQRASAVVSCDTGPMHLSVALGTPTFGIFVATEPGRYGYDREPHRTFDAREGQGGLVYSIDGWLEEVSG